MKLEYEPLLHIKRELHGIPRGMGRFRQYLRTISPNGATLESPSLVRMNPMGIQYRGNICSRLDQLLVCYLVGDETGTNAKRERSSFYTV
jgi:hypothetical protein